MKQLMIYLILATLLLTACGKSRSLTEDIGNTLNTNLSGGQVITEADSHGGFHGDGLTRVEIQMNEGFERVLAAHSDWKAFPLTENLHTALYGRYEQNYAREPIFEDMPVIEKGFYYFQDRHSQSTDPASDSALFSRYSYNFTLAVYDCDSGILYYLEFDT